MTGYLIFTTLVIIATVLNTGVTSLDELPSALGDFQIKGIFPFHSSDGTADLNCGDIDIQNAVINFEAFRYAVNVTNNLGLGKYTIGYKGLDSCDSAVKLKPKIKILCFLQYQEGLIAVIGPSSSDTCLAMSHVFNIWEIVAFTYEASSPVFDDRTTHGKIFRTIPSDSYQIRALLDLVGHFNWTYISAISSCSSFENRAIKRFEELVRSDRRCLARKLILPCVRTEANYELVLRNILQDSNVRVFVLFTRKDDTLGLLKAAKKLRIPPGRLVWIGSTGWGNLALKDYNLQDVAAGALTLVYPSSGNTDNFKRYFLSLNPQSANYSIFIEYWEALFNCSTSFIVNTKNRAPCSGKEKLRENKGWNDFTNVEPVFDAVLGAYKGFYKLNPSCRFTKKFCHTHGIVQAMKISKIMQEATYTSIPRDREVTFDKRGGVIGRYDILNLAPTAAGFAYKRVGEWRAFNNVTTTGSLTMSDKLIYWANSNENAPPKSICSRPCSKSKGEVRVASNIELLQHCCWICTECTFYQKISNNTCTDCGSKEMPNKERDTCVPMPEITIAYFDTIGTVIVCFSILGFIGTTIVVLTFIKFRSSPIVKASGRESSFVMLLGIYLCFVAPITFLTKPGAVICGIQRFIAGLSFSVIYAPLFLKTNRILRIFQSAKMTAAKPHLISPLSQLAISCGIISLQGLLGIVWIIGDRPRVSIKYPATRDKYQSFCESNQYTMALNLLVCLALMLACTWYAFRTRHFPKNFNESRTIMYTLYFSCFAWGIFFPTYLLSSDVDSFARTYTLAMFCDVIGCISLVGLFFKKVSLVVGNAPVIDSGNTIKMTDIGQPSRKDDVKRIVLDGHCEDSPRTTFDDVSNCSNSPNVFKKRSPNASFNEMTSSSKVKIINI